MDLSYHPLSKPTLKKKKEKEVEEEEEKKKKKKCKSITTSTMYCASLHGHLR